MERFDGIRSVHHQARDPGLVWTKDPEPGVRLDVHEPDATLRVLCPDVVPPPDGRWRMYFEAATPDRPT